jgi:Kef-type K+ transport system membrane component KefB
MHESLIVAIVLVATAILSFELRLSSAILEIAAGIVLVYFFPGLGKLDWLNFLSNLGMLGLMFMVGFEVDVRRLRKTWRASLTIGASALALPVVGVFLFSRYWMGLDLPVAALVAIGVSTTSLAIVYNALKERGTLATGEGQIIIAIASVIDVVAMFLLALLMGDLGWGTAIFVAIMLPALLGLPRFGKWIFRRYRGSLVEIDLRFLLVVLIGMGFMAESIGGIHPAMVAFAMGVVMSGAVEGHDEVEQKFKGIVFSLLAPVFFLHAGIQIELRNLSLGVVGTAAALLVISCALKYVGTALPYRWMMKSSGRLAGLLCNYQLSFGIIAAAVGLKVGLLTQDLYATILLVIVGSAFLPAVLLRDRQPEPK